MNAGTCWGKNTIGRTAAVLKGPMMRPLPFSGINVSECGLILGLEVRQYDRLYVGFL